MFRNVLCMDLKRVIGSRRFVLIILGAVLMLLGTAREYVIRFLKLMTPELQTQTGAIDFLKFVMGFDVFKVVVALLISGLYTSSFCQEETNQYLRMILVRTDRVTYVRSKFLANTAVILLATIMVCAGFILVLLGLGFPLVSKDAQGGFLNGTYYIHLIKKYPILYIGLTGLQFGMVIAACSSVGLLFSVYESNGFASIGISGLVFFAMLSLSMTWTNGTIFNVLNLIAMESVFPGGTDANPWLMFAWGMLYPAMVILLCCMKFEHRIKWRIENGII